MTGLDDFGADEHLEPLQVLLHSYAHSAGLTGVGNTMVRSFLRGALAARLMSEAGFAQHPGHTAVPVERPVFVTGIQRSGTTMMQRLLHADPAAQGLEMWLTQLPQPRPPRETWEADPVYAMLRDGFEQHHVENPELAGIHYMSAETVEECWQLLRQSLTTAAYPALAHLPEYAAWLRQADWVPAYARYRRNLQLIGLNDPGRRWVLKNPSHLDALDALMAVFPDALVVQTHRDPVTCVGSACSLAATTTRGWSEVFVGERLGRDVLASLSREAEVFAEARGRYDAAQFVDVAYDDLVGDPVGTVRGVHDAFDLPWDDDVASAVAEEHRRSREGPRAPRHHYDLADYGLTAEQVRAAF
ncbi:sulfotransferase [Nocardioides sp. HDW12B]|nr:sulfotransferase [Nocardioides sp. HDW12B]